MITYNYFGKSQKIYYEKLDNGLDVYVIPNKVGKHFHIELSTRYGSDIENFIPIREKKYSIIPDGLAHFLEHKAFDMPEGDAITYFAKLGVYSNASTNYYCTKYYLDGKKNFDTVLDYLLTMTYTPYFQDESIDNERGIIAQEIKMYDDEVDWLLDKTARECVFSNMLKGNIAGREESLKLINADIMNKVHETFYQPSNMFLIVGGNVKPSHVFDIVKNNQALKEHISKYPIIYKEERENVKVKEEYRELRADIVIPKVKYTFKFDLDSFKMDNTDKLCLYLSMLFTYLFSEGSIFDETMNLKKIAPVYFYEHTLHKNIYAFSLDGESEYADLFVDEVNKIVKDIKITPDDFERLKKVMISLIIRSLDNVTDMVELLSNDLIKGTKELNSYELIKQLDYNEFMDIVEKMDFSNKALVLMLPKDK